MKEKIKRHKTKLVILISVLFVGIMSVQATTIFSSSEVSFDKGTTGMSATTVQEAIEELYDEANSCSSGGSDLSDFDAETGTGIIYSFTGNELSTNDSITSLIEGQDYTTNPSEAPNLENKSDMGCGDSAYYFKHIVSNNKIVTSFACFVSDQEHCMKGVSGGSEFTTNTEIVQAFKTYYNLGDNQCEFTSSKSVCSNNYGFGVSVFSSGDINMGESCACALDVYDSKITTSCAG